MSCISFALCGRFRLTLVVPTVQQIERSLLWKPSSQPCASQRMPLPQQLLLRQAPPLGLICRQGNGWTICCLARIEGAATVEQQRRRARKRQRDGLWWIQRLLVSQRGHISMLKLLHGPAESGLVFPIDYLFWCVRSSTSSDYSTRESYSFGQILSSSSRLASMQMTTLFFSHSCAPGTSRRKRLSTLTNCCLRTFWVACSSFNCSPP